MIQDPWRQHLLPTFEQNSNAQFFTAKWYTWAPKSGKSRFSRRIFLWAALSSLDIRTRKLKLVISGPNEADFLRPPNCFRFRDMRGQSRSIFERSTTPAPQADEFRNSVWTESLRIVTGIHISNFTIIASREVRLSQCTASSTVSIPYQLHSSHE